MDAGACLRYLQREIHTAVAATIDTDGLPVTCAVDIMDADEGGLYFLTARGKGFYGRLKATGYLSLTGIKGENTMSRTAISVRGKVRELGGAPLPRLFDMNPYMREIYTTPASQRALTVFRLYAGEGEWFDLSKKPIERFSFSFGQAVLNPEGYFITEACTGCRICEAVCPQGCIDFSAVPAVIRQAHCLRCGNCMEVCPQSAVIREDEK